MEAHEIMQDLVIKLSQFIEDEARSCSKEPSLITPEYVFRMWGGTVSLDKIKVALDIIWS